MSCRHATPGVRRDLAEEDRGLVVALLRHGLEAAERLLEAHVHDVGPAERDHAAPVAVAHAVDRGEAEAGGEHAVVGRRCAAALDVAEGRRAGLDARALLDDGRDLLADAAEPRAAEGVEPALAVRVGRVLGDEALRDDDERRAPAVVGRADPADDLVHARLLLGDEDRVRARGHAGVQRDPADVPAHDLGHHAAAVRVARGAEAVHGVGRDLHRGVEAERVVGGVEVVVDGLGDSDDLEARVGEALGCRERALAADGEDRVDAEAVEVLLDPLHASVALERVRAAGAEDRAALLADALDVAARERHDVAVDDAPPAVAEAHELLLVDGRSLEHRPADDRVESGAVSA